MDDRSIAWMLSGGTRFETAEVRHARIHASTLRAAHTELVASSRAHTADRPGLLVRARTALGLAAASIAPATSPDCCGA